VRRRDEEAGVDLGWDGLGFATAVDDFFCCDFALAGAAAGFVLVLFGAVGRFREI
jgi:hypothetical protein